MDPIGFVPREFSGLILCFWKNQPVQPILTWNLSENSRKDHGTNPSCTKSKFPVCWNNMVNVGKYENMLVFIVNIGNWDWIGKPSEGGIPILKFTSPSGRYQLSRIISDRNWDERYLSVEQWTSMKLYKPKDGDGLSSGNSAGDQLGMVKWQCGKVTSLKWPFGKLGLVSSNYLNLITKLLSAPKFLCFSLGRNPSTPIDFTSWFSTIFTPPNSKGSNSFASMGEFYDEKTWDEKFFHLFKEACSTGCQPIGRCLKCKPMPSQQQTCIYAIFTWYYH